MLRNFVCRECVAAKFARIGVPVAIAIGGIALGLGTSAVHADTVSIAGPTSFSTTPPGVDLSTGASDWAEFGGNGTQNGLQAPTGTNFTQATSTDGSTAFGTSTTWASTGYPIFQYTLNGSTVTNDGDFVQSPHSGQNNLTFDLNVAAGASETVDVYAGYHGFDNNPYNSSVNQTNYQLTATLGTGTPVGDQTPLPMAVVTGSYYAGKYAITVDNTSAAAELLAVNAQSNPNTTYYNAFFGASVSSGTAVPEPATLGLIGIGALGLLRRKRKVLA